MLIANFVCYIQVLHPNFGKSGVCTLLVGLQTRWSPQTTVMLVFFRHKLDCIFVMLLEILNILFGRTAHVICLTSWAGYEGVDEHSTTAIKPELRGLSRWSYFSASHSNMKSWFPSYRMHRWNQQWCSFTQKTGLSLMPKSENMCKRLVWFKLAFSGASHYLFAAC